MITYKIVGTLHELCGFKCPKSYPKSMKAFWNSRSLESCDGGVLAMDGKKVIGWFRWNNRGSTMYAYGTYVLPAYRKQGVAIKLWRRALNRVKPTLAVVYTTSRGGEKLTSALRKKFSKFAWEIVKIW